MNFFKQAQEFAASANVNTDKEGAAAAPAASGGFGSFVSEAQNMLMTQTAPAAAPVQSAGAQSTLPGGRQAPTNAELMESTKLLFGAAQGQKVDNTKLAGAAEDLIGGLAAHGNLDQGQYSSYINQAEQYLHKYAGEDQAAAKSAAPAAAPAPPAEKAVSEGPASEAAPAPAPTPVPAEAAAAPAPAPTADEGAADKFSLPASVPSWMK